MILRFQVFVIQNLPPGIIICMRPANERRRYNVTSPLIGWAHSQNNPCDSHSISQSVVWPNIPCPYKIKSCEYSLCEPIYNNSQLWQHSRKLIMRLPGPTQGWQCRSNVTNVFLRPRRHCNAILRARTNFKLSMLTLKNFITRIGRTKPDSISLPDFLDHS